MKNLSFLSQFTPPTIANDWQRKWFHRRPRLSFIARKSVEPTHCSFIQLHLVRRHGSTGTKAGITSLLMPCQSEETDMRKRISEIKARGADIVGHGSVLKVLIISLGLLAAAFIIVFMVA